MSRRRQADGSSPTGNLDSLLDTMTNVVGILIIVIIVSQISVAEAVKRIRKGLEPVSAEQLVELETEKGQVAKLIETMQSATPEKPDPAALAQLQRQLDQARKKVATDAQQQQQLEGLADLFADKQKELQQIKQLVKTKQEGLVGLDQMLARLELEKIPAKRVRLPDPRDPNEKAGEVMFFCAGERVMLVDYPGLLKRTVEAITANKGLVAEMKGKVPYYDQEKTKKFIQGKKISSNGVTVSINTFKDRPWGQLVLTPNLKSGGQTVSEGRRKGAALLKQIDDVKWARDYIVFYVHPDAFETYLQVRRMAEDNSIPVGWKPTNQKEFKESLPGIRFAHQPPPVVDPDKKPTPEKPAPKPKKKPKLLD